MDYSDLNATPQQESGYFNDSSFSLIKSTPLLDSTSRKRKRTSHFNDSPISSPQLSSTAKDIVTDFRDLGLSTASTPEKQIKSNAGLARFVVVPSPIQESHALLYQNIKNIKPGRKSCLSFLRTKNAKTNKYDTFEYRELLQKVTENNVIMTEIFKYLSCGDLYRLNTVSRGFKRAIEIDYKANARLQSYMNIYKVNKENYVITPPNSPDKCDSPPHTNSNNLNLFIKAGKRLSREQSLTRCRACNFVTVVENDVCQCQNISCALIYCLKCSSYSQSGPENFTDKCGNSELLPLGNLSNFLDSGYNSSLNNSSATVSVKRNLFAASNSARKKIQRRSDIVGTVLPIAKVVSKRKSNSFSSELDCESSPPSNVTFGVCSKQSKKNLKRLTR